MSERGSVTVWLLGLSVCLLFLGGLSVDLWRVMNTRRELVSVVDAAAVEGAGAIDEFRFRALRQVRLDPSRARAAAARHLARHMPEDATSHVRADTDRVRVESSVRVRLSLLGVLLPDARLRVRAIAEVEPQRRP